jgi:hypothetical protein
VCSAKLILYAEQRTQDRYKYMASPQHRLPNKMFSESDRLCLCDIRHHPCDYCKAKTPPLSRQDATLSEATYPIRQKKEGPSKKKVWWAEDNKENIPSKDVKEEDPQHHVKKEE